MDKKLKLPELPENQRWKITEDLFFINVYLQERRKRWGWKTIAKSIEYSGGGTAAVRQCVYRIQNREHLAQIGREIAFVKAEDRARVPYGVTKR